MQEIKPAVHDLFSTERQMDERLATGRRRCFSGGNGD